MKGLERHSSQYTYDTPTERHTMIFPKHDALKMGFKTYEQALAWACRKSKFGGCFEEEVVLDAKGERIYVAYWLPSNHPLVAEFAWS